VTVADDLKMAQPEGRLHDLAGAEHLVAVRHIAQLPERRGRAEPGVMVAQIADPLPRRPGIEPWARTFW
jgi:hypothetical protein